MPSYTKVHVLNDMNLLYSALETLVTNRIIGGITKSMSTELDVFTLYEDAGLTKEFLKIERINSGAVYFRYTFTVSDGAVYTITNVNYTGYSDNVRAYAIQFAYSCKNGVIFTANWSGGYYPAYGTAPSYCVIITRSNMNKPIAVVINQDSYGMDINRIKTNMNTEYCIASSDISPINGITRIAPKTQMQTVITPCFSCSAPTDLSYTPDAGRVLASTFTYAVLSPELHEITYDGETWLTNGYYALRT